MQDAQTAGTTSTTQTRVTIASESLRLLRDKVRERLRTARGLANGGGAIVNTTSVVGRTARPRLSSQRACANLPRFRERPDRRRAVRSAAAHARRSNDNARASADRFGQIALARKAKRSRKSREWRRLARCSCAQRYARVGHGKVKRVRGQSAPADSGRRWMAAVGYVRPKPA